MKIIEEWDTKNNQEAEPDFLKRRDETGVDISESFYPRPDAEMPGQADTIEEGAEAGAADDEMAEGEQGPDERLVMQMFRSAMNVGLEHQQRQEGRWLKGYKAWKNEHLSGSKYLSQRFSGRSRLFRPKTRATVRKKQAEAASALFSTQDALILSATNPADEAQAASAEVLQELVSFRLDRSNENAGIPWFMIAMGSHHSAQVTGLCCSKQYWEYKTETYTEMVEAPFELPHPITGEMMQWGTIMKPVQKVRKIRDRPRIRLYPIEDVIRDPSAAWEDQAQESGFIILRNPMSVADAKVFIGQQDDKAAVQFYAVPDSVIEAAAGPASQSGGQTSGNMRRGRSNDGQDRLNDYASNRAFSTVWLNECFMKIDGKDYVFWTLGERQIISKIVPVAEAYPEQGGARPVTIGVATLEPFEIDPMAPVEAWQPLQQEMNDLVNLRLDTVKQTIAPLAIVKKGRGIDVRAVQNRSPDSVVFVSEATDLTFDRPGDVGQASYAEMEKLNADFDETAGNFSIGSVQTNRQLGETVGGMNLMSSNANAMGEFDLRVWIETWAEPVLRQLVKLEQYYEDDETVLAIAADKAKLFQKFQGNPDWDWLLTQQVQLTLNVGLGAADPMQTMNKFGAATQIASTVLGGPLGASAKPDAIIDEIYGKAGFKNAAERFFDFEGNDPRLQQAQQMIEEMQQALQEAQQAAEDKEAERASKENIAKLNAIVEMAKNEQAHMHQQTNYMDQLAGEMSKLGVQHSMGMEKDAAQQGFQAEQAQRDQAFQQQQAQQPQADMMKMLQPLIQQMQQMQQQIAALAQR